MTTLVLFGTLLKSTRTTKGLLLKEMAGLAGLDAGLLSKIENNERRATAEQCETFIQLLDADAVCFRTTWLASKILYEIEGKPLQYEALQTALELLKKKEEESETLESIFAEIETYRTEIENIYSVLTSFKAYCIHECCSIRGNTLSVDDIYEIIEKGNTVGGKSIEHHFEVWQFKKAWPLAEQIFRNEIPLNGTNIWRIHLLINGLQFSNINASLNHDNVLNTDYFISTLDQNIPNNGSVQQYLELFVKLQYHYNDSCETTKTLRLLLYLLLWQIGLPIKTTIHLTPSEIKNLTPNQIVKRLAKNILNALTLKSN